MIKEIIRGASLGVTLLGLSACSVEPSEVMRSSSPDGKATAVLLRQDGGGAAGSVAYELFFTEQTENKVSTQPSLVASHCEGISIAWKDETTLLVTYKPGCVIRKFTNQWYSALAIKNAQSANVEIILSRNTPSE